MSFVHLHNHTHYSLLDGLTKLDELIATAKADGAPAVAITDHGVMYGVIEFYQKCKKAGIKPIIGVEAYLAPESRLSKSTKENERSYHLILLAKNLAGYKNLIKLTTSAHLEGYYYKPRIDWEILKEHSEGLIACTACLGGEIPRLLMSGKEEKARKRILEYKELFGPDNFYLEIQSHPNLEGQAELNQKLIELSKEYDVPLVATNDLHYLRAEDYDAQDVLLCLQTKKKKNDPNRMAMHGGDFYYKSAAEMAAAFPEVPEAISNTIKIAEACNLELELGKIQLPLFAVPEGYTEATYLRKITLDGLVKRYKQNYEEVSAEVRERMDYELEVINRMGWPSYFLIVADFVNWAKDSGIVVGPGRGSAAGSLVCYLTGITNINPLTYDLLFERFLNPERISMPDIDMDFADVRRDEVLKYVAQKYGQDHVSQIITFGTMAARAAIRDVGRVLDYPYSYCDKLAKMIPQFSKIDEALRDSAELKEMYDKEIEAKTIIDHARKLEGVSRHASTHACGVLITKDPLVENAPVQYASSADRSIVSQYSLHPIEDLGLLKMDFLGLKNLTIIESAIKIIKNTRGIEIDIDNIPLDDKAAFKLFRDGETTGVFQFESSGMKRYLKELKPTELEDIIAMVALYRPGPMEWIPDFINGKHGRIKPTYLHPKLEPILKKTYGVAIYQEQVMQMGRDLAGMTMGEADVLRKAMGKKIAKLMTEQKEKFVEGCVKNGINKKLAENIFSFIEPFAGYGFNRSHAACYAMIAYETAYLKARWPTEFMAALLTAEQNDTDRISELIEECHRAGIDVREPDINQFFGSFTVITSATEQNRPAGATEEAKMIRFGMKAIKNVGEHITDTLIAERKERGPFQSLDDLLERVTDKDLNKKTLESLIKCGALDKFGERGMLLANIENILSFNKEINKTQNSNQVSLFGNTTIMPQRKIKLNPAPAATMEDKLRWEKELLGVYITEHPFASYSLALKEAGLSLKTMIELSKASDGVNALSAGIIIKIKKILTRKNEPMLFVKIEDTTGLMEVLVFPKTLKSTAEVWQEGKAVLFQGVISDKDQEKKILVNGAVTLTKENLKKQIDDLSKSIKPANNGFGRRSFYKPAETSAAPAPAKPAPQSNSLKIVISEQCAAEELEKLKNLILEHKGEDKVYFKLQAAGGQIIETGFRVNNSSVLIGGIRSLCGQNVEVVEA